MDAARSTRLFPGFTTAELRARLAGDMDAETRSKMEGEVARRDAGISTVRATPQVPALSERAKQRREISQMRKQR